MASEYCPQCGTGRTGALRFCRSCGFDYDTLGTVEQRPVAAPPAVPAPVTPSPVTPASPAERRRLPLVPIGVLLLVGVVAAAALSNMSPGQTASGAGSSPDPTATPAPTSTARPATQRPTTPPPATPAPTEAPSTGLFVPGDVVTVTSDDEPYLDIVVSEVKQVSKYDGEYFDDTPEIKGNVFIHARISYTSLQDGATYNPFDWSVFVNDQAVDNFAFVSEGPKPELNSGELPNGRKATGYVVYEVPAAGRVVLSYNGSFFNDAPVFEVVLRDK